MTQRSDVELVRLSDRLLHDVQMYFHVARRLVRLPAGFEEAPPWDIETALVESFAMHTRALADFFYTFNRPRHAHDAVAFHYFASPSAWQGIAGDPGPWLSQVRARAKAGQRQAPVDRFGEQVAHLNYRRAPVSDYARGWPVMQLASEVGFALRAFTLAVEGSKVSTDFRTKAWREIPVAARLDRPLLPMGIWSRPALARPPS